MSNSDFRISRPGTTFRDEKLYVFQTNDIRVLAAFPRMLAWKKNISQPFWASFRAKISIPANVEGQIHRLESPYMEENGQAVFGFCIPPEFKKGSRSELSWLRWFAMIPVELRELIRKFPARDRQWHLLSLCARIGEPALDLVRSNPALAYGLASGFVFHPVCQPMRSARALLKLGKKQRNALGWLGFPKTDQARKITRKVIHKAIGISSLLYLRQSMTDEMMVKAMSHLPRLNAGVIRIATDPELLPLVAPTLLEEIAHSRKEDAHAKSAYLLRDSIAMYQLLFPNRKFPRPTRHVRNLVETHNALIEDLDQAQVVRNMNLPFPPPPVVGITDIIEPITDAWELAEEARVQSNCVASYAMRVATGRNYIYRVIKPERCTLSIAKRGNNWVVSELKRTCNEMASKATWAAIQQWLAQNGIEDEALSDDYFFNDPEIPF